MSTELVWVAAIVVAAIGPMVHSTFSKTVQPAKYRAFTFVWPFAVMSSLPLLWTDELSPQLFGFFLLTLLSIAVCCGVLLFRHRQR